MSKKFKIKEIIDSIEKNGLPQAFGLFWVAADGDTEIYALKNKHKATGACAVGMAAYNLDVDPNQLHWVLPHARMIERWNDDSKLSFKEIADHYRSAWPNILEDVVEVPEE